MTNKSETVEVDFDAPWFVFPDPKTGQGIVVSMGDLRRMATGDATISKGLARALAAHAVMTVP